MKINFNNYDDFKEKAEKEKLRLLLDIEEELFDNVDDHENLYEMAQEIALLCDKRPKQVEKLLCEMGENNIFRLEGDL